jgi:hypothetical protein
MAIDHEMIPKDVIETDASMHQLHELVTFLYGHGICNERPISQNLGIMGGWAVYFTLQEHWPKFRGQKYLGSRDIDIFLLCEESRFEIFLDAVKELGYWVKDDREYVKVIYKDPKGIDPSTPMIIPQKEFSKYLPEERIEHHLDIFCGLTCSDSGRSCKYKLVGQLENLYSVFDRAGQIKISGKKIALPDLSDLLVLKGRALFGLNRLVEKQLKDMCDIIALSTLPTFDETCRENTKNLDYLKTIFDYIQDHLLLSDVSLILFNVTDTDYISKLIGTKNEIIKSYLP